jgi:hypothetical protein
VRNDVIELIVKGSRHATKARVNKTDIGQVEFSQPIVCEPDIRPRTVYPNKFRMLSINGQRKKIGAVSATKLEVAICPQGRTRSTVEQ